MWILSDDEVLVNLDYVKNIEQHYNLIRASYKDGDIMLLSNKVIQGKTDYITHFTYLHFTELLNQIQHAKFSIIQCETVRENVWDRHHIEASKQLKSLFNFLDDDSDFTVEFKNYIPVWEYINPLKKVKEHPEWTGDGNEKDCELIWASIKEFNNK